MFYYVYRVTNTVNNKFYIGKRRHTDPFNDSYLGSGKQIKSAIEKYGRHSFVKEIIEVFNTNEEAATLERQLVDQQTISDPLCYNMHIGGHGGFEHVNNNPVARAEASKASAAYNKANGIGGTSRWSEEGRQRIIEQCLKNNRDGLTKGWTHSQTAKKKISRAQSGEKNSQHGKRVYIDSLFNGNIPSTSVLNKHHKFKEGEQPQGWILLSEWRNNRKDQSKGSTGRHWYNDGTKNYYLYPTDEKVPQLTKGRLI